MNTLSTISEERWVPHRLQERLEVLGLAAWLLGRDGFCHRAPPELSSLERLIIRSPIFAAQVRRRWDDLLTGRGGVIALWPGLWLVPLPQARRRRIGAMQRPEMLPVVLLMGSELLSAEQTGHLFSAAAVDRQAFFAQHPAPSWISAGEAHRLAAMLSWMHEDASEIDRRFTELQTLSTELAESYEELSLLYKLSTTMTVRRSPETFLTQACQDLEQTLGLRWMALQLVENNARLQDLTGLMVSVGQSLLPRERLRRVGFDLMARYGGFDQPTIIDDPSELRIPGFEQAGPGLLVVPLRTDGMLLGVLYGGEKISGAHISSVDSKLCNSLASSLTIFLENRMLYEDVQAMFMGTLHALTSAIDAKDSYTHGHSERVALLSCHLARAVGLDAATCERVYLAGLIHDLGKIGVPESVLTKPGRLTKEEFDLIKRHPQIGARILADIRQMRDLIPGVSSHHERWDGGGYPDGQKGEEIPLFGRLIGLADAFDAMSSSRTYRVAMDHEGVLDEIRRCTGTQFDPHLTEVFLQLDFTDYFDLIRRHQQREEKKI